jgi:hypothetical protein
VSKAFGMQGFPVILRVYLEGSMLRSFFSLRPVTAVAICISVGGSALLAADNNTQTGWGTSESSSAASVPKVQNLGVIDPSNLDSSGFTAAAATEFRNAAYGTGGVALRNRATGSIGISGVTGPVQGAYLYWAVITQGAPAVSATKVTLAREFPAPAASAVITGTAIGTGAQPCWAGDRITVFRGKVPNTLANGNGLYRVSLSAGAAGSTAGGDPWVVTPALPLWEGASLVIVGAGTGTVILYDSGLAGATFQTTLSYTLNFGLSASGTKTLFDSIGADGQFGKSRLALQLAKDTTRINGTLIAGPGSTYNDSDWNGSSGLPLPQLWDDTGHDITAQTPRGTSSIPVFITSGGNGTKSDDCLTPVANILEIH